MKFLTATFVSLLLFAGVVMGDASRTSTIHQDADLAENTQTQIFSPHDIRNVLGALQMISEGRKVFRYDTFDDETFRGDALGHQEAIAGLLMDGKAFQPDGDPAATLIPPAFGLAGVNLHTWTGWGLVTHWNAFVDPRLDNLIRFPIAAAAGFGEDRQNPDLVTPKLAALQFYQLSIGAPSPPSGSFDKQAGVRGEVLFNSHADCAHRPVPPLYTEPGWNMHSADEIGMGGFQAARGPDEAYRTAPLNGLWSHGKRGYYHDGRFATLDEVVDHYDGHFFLGLDEQDKADLIHSLRSI